MADTYLQLVNKLRNRFNEISLNSTTWSLTVGWDQFTKEAVNNAYYDIINAEMEWPFLHQSATLKTVPGTQFYTPTLTAPSGFISPSELKEIDWNSFYLIPNETLATITNEVHTVGSDSTITVTNFANWQIDGGVQYVAGPTSLTPVPGDPAVGQYTVLGGLYYFNAADIGASVQITYSTAVNSVQAQPVLPKHLMYLDFDTWRETLLAQDIGVFKSGQNIPDYVIRPQIHGQLGLSPIPNRIYTINFEYWLAALELANMTDLPLTPARFGQVIVDGAAMYCHKFREDLQMATALEKKFNAGIQKMRTELINRESTMNAGFYWYRHGTTYTLNTN